MIVLLTSAHHTYTHGLLTRGAELEFRVRSYRQILREQSASAATYIFSDLDRLGYWELELAARLYRLLRSAGCRVLNDPAKVHQRVGLLRTLHALGLNSFDVHRVEDGERPSRFPVFLRTISAHRGPLSALLSDPNEVEQAVAAALDLGVPLRELILVEYCAEPMRSGLFRKLAIHRIGDHMAPAICVHDDGWAAKNGKFGIASEAEYRDEHDLIATGRYVEAVRPAFEAASVDYGRADFAFVAGRVEIYEINTNPSLDLFLQHPSALRVASSALEMEGVRTGLAALDSPRSKHRVRLDDTLLRGQRRRDRHVRGEPWRI